MHLSRQVQQTVALVVSKYLLLSQVRYVRSQTKKNERTHTRTAAGVQVQVHVRAHTLLCAVLHTKPSCILHYCHTPNVRTNKLQGVPSADTRSVGWREKKKQKQSRQPRCPRIESPVSVKRNPAVWGIFFPTKVPSCLILALDHPCFWLLL